MPMSFGFLLAQVKNASVLAATFPLSDLGRICAVPLRCLTSVILFYTLAKRTDAYHSISPVLLNYLPQA